MRSKCLQIKHFRSIEDQALEFAPMTMVYGPNGAGKSSLLYSLLTLKSVLLDSNRNANAFFNFNFINLGDYRGVVFDHRTANNIELSLTLSEKGHSFTYELIIGQKEGSLNLYASRNGGPLGEFRLPVTFPYPAHQREQQTITYDEIAFPVIWDGITAQVQVETPDERAKETAYHLGAMLNAPMELLRRIGVIPLKRGFTKPTYSSVPVTGFLTEEGEVATLLANDKYLVQKVSHYLEETLGRDFRVNVTPGTATFSLDTTDKNTGLGSELVNEGFGVNQVVYMLTKCLHGDAEWLCIEEPELHLHPSAIRKLAKTFLRIAHDESKGFLISTHSETFVTALLAMIAKGEANPSDLAFYWAKKDGKSTQFERQEVNEKGQLKGGLSSFMEGELEDIAAFLGIDE